MANGLASRLKHEGPASDLFLNPRAPMGGGGVTRVRIAIPGERNVEFLSGDIAAKNIGVCDASNSSGQIHKR